MLKRSEVRKITLKNWIFRIIFFGVAVMVVMFFTIPWYAGSRMEEQARENNARMTEMYLAYLDSSVDGINKLLSQFAYQSDDISTLAMTEDEGERYLAKINVMQRLEEASVIYNVFDGIFVYSQSEFEDAFLCQLRTGVSGSQQEDMKEIIRDYEQEYSLNSWELVKYGSRDYLMRVVKTGSTSCGAWVEAASLIRPLGEYEDAGIFLFLDREGRCISSSDSTLPEHLNLSEKDNGRIIRLEGQRYLQTMEKSKYLPAAMAVLIPERQYRGDIYYVQNILGLLMVAALLIFPILGRLLTKNITAPVGQLTESMKAVQEGKLDTRVKAGSRFDEFDQIGRYFNNMISELQRLQRDVYERKIREQKIQLQYLQTQIRPHFFLNTLNVIYSFSLVKRNDLIEKMVVCLSKYFSYRFKSTDSFVPLREEKEHIENYLELHRLRYQSQFRCQIEIEEVLLDARIPPLIIQTFVENSLKYGFLKERIFEMEIVAEVLSTEKEQKLKITVTDNGPGYGRQILEEAGRGKILHGHGQGIGINNVIQRLQLLYQGQAEIKLSDMPGGGACSEIIMPLEFTDEEETEDKE